MSQHWFSILSGEENRVKKPLQTGDDELCGIDHFDLEMGKQLEGWNPNASLRSTSVEDDGDADDILCNHLEVPIVSPRLREALKAASVADNDIQYLPIRIFQSTGEEVKGYAIANIISRIAALDYDRSKMLRLHKSEIDPLTSKLKVRSIWNAALHKEPLAGHDVIRLVEFFPPVFVSERFAQVFRKGKFTGSVLVPVAGCQ